MMLVKSELLFVNSGLTIDNLLLAIDNSWSFSKYDMDAVEKIDEMIAFAESVDVSKAVEWVEEN